MSFNIPLNSLKKSLKFILKEVFRRKVLLISLTVLFLTLPFFFYVMNHQKKVDAAWMNDNWLYRKAVAIPSHTTLETNVYVTVPTFDATDTSKFQVDCGDLRFTKQNGEQLPYFVVDCDATANIHVQFDSLPAGATTYYVYYGNPSAANGFSSADFAAAATGLGVQALAAEEKSAGPVAYWKFDEGTDTNTQDSTANNNDGTITGATWKSEDQCISGKCLYFDGSGDYVDMGTNVGNYTDNFSVSGWVRTATKNTRILSRRETTNGTQYDLYLDTSSGRASFYDGTTQFYSTSTLTDNK